MSCRLRREVGVALVISGMIGILPSLWLFFARIDPWVTTQSKDDRVSDAVAKLLPVVGREEFGNEALAVALYKGEKVLVKQERIHAGGIVGQILRWETGAIVIFSLLLIVGAILLARV